MGHDVEVREVASRPVLTVRARTVPSAMASVYRERLAALLAHLEQIGARSEGPPFAVFHVYRDDLVDMEVGLPVPAGLPDAGPFVRKDLPTGRAAATVHEGSYRGLAEAHDAVTAWIDANGAEASGPPREVYLVGPADGADPPGYRTEVLYPIR